MRATTLVLELEWRGEVRSLNLEVDADTFSAASVREAAERLVQYWWNAAATVTTTTDGVRVTDTELHDVLATPKPLLHLAMAAPAPPVSVDSRVPAPPPPVDPKAADEASADTGAVHWVTIEEFQRRMRNFDPARLGAYIDAVRPTIASDSTEAQRASLRPVQRVLLGLQTTLQKMPSRAERTINWLLRALVGDDDDNRLVRWALVDCCEAAKDEEECKRLLGAFAELVIEELDLHVATAVVVHTPPQQEPVVVPQTQMVDDDSDNDSDSDSDSESVASDSEDAAAPTVGTTECESAQQELDEVLESLRMRNNEDDAAKRAELEQRRDALEAQIDATCRATTATRARGFWTGLVQRLFAEIPALRYGATLEQLRPHVRARMEWTDDAAPEAKSAMKAVATALQPNRRKRARVFCAIDPAPNRHIGFYVPCAVVTAANVHDIINALRKSARDTIGTFDRAHVHAQLQTELARETSLAVTHALKREFRRRTHQSLPADVVVPHTLAVDDVAPIVAKFAALRQALQNQHHEGIADSVILQRILDHNNDDDATLIQAITVQ